MSRPWSRWVSTTKSHPASPRAFIGESRDPSSCVSRRALTWRCGRSGPITSKFFEISWTTSAPTKGDRHVDSVAASRETSEAPDRDARRPGLRPLPLDRRYRPHRQFADEQAEINSHIFAFGFTFLVLITAWIIYTTYMSVLPGEVRAITFLNVALLLLVALIPYLLNSVELANPSLSSAEVSAIGNYASTLFALDLTGIMLILAAFAHVISIEERNLVAPELARLFRNGRNRLAILSLATAG